MTHHHPTARTSSHGTLHRLNTPTVFETATTLAHILAQAEPEWRKEIVNGTVEHRAFYAFHISHHTPDRQAMSIILAAAASHVDASLTSNIDVDVSSLNFKKSFPLHSMLLALRKLEFDLSACFHKTETGYEFRPSEELVQSFPGLHKSHLLKALLPETSKQIQCYYKVPECHTIDSIFGLQVQPEAMVDEATFQQRSNMQMKITGHPLTESICFDHAELSVDAYQQIIRKLHHSGRPH